MVTFEEFTLRAFLGMEDAARNAAINTMWARLIGEQEHVVPLWPEGCVPNYTEDYLPQLPPSLSLFLPEGDAAYWERLFRKVTVDATLVALTFPEGEKQS